MSPSLSIIIHHDQSVKQRIGFLVSFSWCIIIIYRLTRTGSIQQGKSAQKSRHIILEKRIRFKTVYAAVKSLLNVGASSLKAR